MAVLCCWVYLVLAVLGGGRQVRAFWWPFSTGEGAEMEIETEAVRREPVAFEMASAEQKFLAEAQHYMGLSPLEACQQEVVGRLRGSCGALGEDELGKMAVALLNCQSQAENRPTFTCTPHMSLAECTSGMDPSVWNAYHIVSNRARSVCYATRQQQFRRQTEAVVNRLSSSTLEQLQAMSELSEQQAEVKQLARSSLEALQEAQREAEVRERETAARQDGMSEKIATNLEHLAQEKVLIHSGQQLLANMTTDVRRQLEVASDMLGSQEQHMKQGQQEILEDITAVRQNIQEVWGRIDNRTSQLLGVLEDITDHYQTTLDSLKVINETLVGMQGMVETMSSTVNSQLDWVVGQLGGANKGLRVLTSCVGHGLFLLASMLLAVFVRVPAPTRIILLVAVVTNAVLDIRVGVALTFTALAAMTTMVALLNWLILSIRRTRSLSAPTYTLPSSQPHSSQPHSSHLQSDSFTPSCTLHESPGASCDDSLEYEVDVKPRSSSSSRASRDLTPHFRAAETLCSTPYKASSSAGGSARCVAMTHTGMQCRLRALRGAATCHRHT